MKKNWKFAKNDFVDILTNDKIKIENPNWPENLSKKAIKKMFD